MPLIYQAPLFESAQFLITPLGPEDVEEVIQCVLATFLEGEPMCAALGLTEKDFKLFTRLFTEKAAREGLSVIARHPMTNELMGCIISDDMASEPPTGLENIPERTLPIVYLLEELDAKFLERNPPAPGQYFHMFICGVYKKFSGLQLTPALTKASEKLAAGKGFKTALIEATGPISQHILINKMGYVQEAALAYKEFCYKNSYPFRNISECSACLLLSKSL